MAERIQVVLVTMFEPEGKPGELSKLREALGLEPVKGDVVRQLGLAPGQLLRRGGVLAMVAGVGTANTALSIAALGWSGVYDLRDAYWIISGIAGGDPAVMSLGSVGISDWVVDTDLAYEFALSEVSPEWATGILPLGAQEPFAGCAGADEEFGARSYQVFQLNDTLVDWAYRVTLSTELVSSEAMCKAAQAFTATPAAMTAPKVLKGATQTGARFIHGEIMTDWARKWVRFWTHGQATLHTGAMEDSGTLLAIRTLAGTGRTDARRVLIIRSCSNMMMPPPGVNPVRHLTGEPGQSVHFPGFEPAIENGCRVTCRIIQQILAGHAPV